VTLVCAHRVNDPSALADVPTRFGVEIDLRSDGDRLILEHDPFLSGPGFDDWLREYSHSFIVVNIKEEGLEERIIDSLVAAGVDSWAFLDQSLPFLVRGLRLGRVQTMVRISEYESEETAFALPVRPEWVWVDSFTGRWPSSATLNLLHDHGFKLMVVSPELQGRSLNDEMDKITELFELAGLKLDGVCTKQPLVWEKPEASWWAQ